MAQLCNGSLLWDTDTTWYSAWPQFTDCFQNTVLMWVPCGWLWLTSPFYIYYILTVSKTVLSSRCFFIIKMVTCAALVIISAVEIGDASLQPGSEDFTSLYITPIIKVVTFAYALILMYMERKKGFITSGILFVFWLLFTVAGIVPFYTKIIQKVYNQDTTKFCLFCIYYALVIMELILGCFAETVTTTKSTCPEVSASFFSKITFLWANSLLTKGYRKLLTEDDTYDLHPRDNSDNNVPLFLLNWKEQLNRLIQRCAAKKSPSSTDYETRHTDSSGEGTNEKTPLLPKQVDWKRATSDKKEQASLWKALLRTFWFEILQSQIWKLLYDVLYFTNPLLLGELIDFTEDKTSPAWKGYTLAVTMFCSILVQSVMFHATWHYCTSLALRVRSVLISTIYRKALTMNNQARQESTTGEIVNLMSVDTEHIKNTVQWMWGSWSSLVQIALSLYLLYNTLGVPVLAGLGVMVVIIPLNYIIMTYWQKYQIQLMKFKDVRMKIINEVLNAIKIIKLYAWEPSFEDRIVDIRNKELHFLWKISLLEAWGIFTWTLSPYLVSLATIFTYVYTSPDHYLHPKTAFVAVALLNNLGYAVSALPDILSAYVQAYVSIMRISKYLNTIDLDETRVRENCRRTAGEDEAVTVRNATFTWNEDSKPSLHITNLVVEKGHMVAIVGQVGEGKTSLVSAILGEMIKCMGSVTLKGTLAYVPQQAWIQNNTLQNNILFGKSMDRELYDQVLECCALKPDLDVLPAGDQTEIGERGINLSGGQKQRVSLARAVYNDADIYLLDDPLSAVDSHVGKHIFEKLLSKTGLLGNKTRILVTHGIQWLPMMDYIVVMTDGQISERGAYQQLLQSNGSFSQFLHNYLLNNSDEDNYKQNVDESATRSQKSNTDSCEISNSAVTYGIESCDKSKKSCDHEHLAAVKRKEGKLVEDEKTQEGKVTWNVYGSYIKAIGFRVLVLCAILYALYTAGSMASNIWLSQWTDNSELKNFTLYPANSTERMDKNNFYLGFYGGLGAVQAASMLTFCFLWASRAVQASRILHSKMVTGVLSAKMAFFDTTPTGRITNRFSQDIDTIDLRMQHLLQYAFNTMFIILSCVIVISYSTPIFLVVIVPLFFLYYGVQVFYVQTARQLKRLESKTRSPIYSHFMETLAGSSVIRAFKQQSRFIKESEVRVDRNQRFAFYGFVAQRWLGFRLETLGNVIILAASIFAVASRDQISGGIVGLSISYALQITQNLYYMVRMMSELETQVVCVERVKQYSEVESEAECSDAKQELEASWPRQGIIQFRNYSTRYRPGLELVLKDFTFTVHSGEKVGIVGRTGAGKSSLTLSLFRLIEAAGGEINIDGVDISTIGLHDLRNKLTILPQDPVIFTGSLRRNVDPFNEYCDREIWRALDHAHLKNFVERLPGSLDYECSEGGENMSVGQRQLLCLTRALLRKNKILVLDEATAAVDIETDDLIQETVRSEFKECTVLTIAHRLNTVMDYDRILVLEKGRLVECDAPSVLLQQRDSLFYSMAVSAGLILEPQQSKTSL